PWPGKRSSIMGNTIRSGNRPRRRLNSPTARGNRAGRHGLNEHFGNILEKWRDSEARPDEVSLTTRLSRQRQEPLHGNRQPGPGNRPLYLTEAALCHAPARGRWPGAVLSAPGRGVLSLLPHSLRDSRELCPRPNAARPRAVFPNTGYLVTNRCPPIP